jgi:hypothetical protein
MRGTGYAAVVLNRAPQCKVLSFDVFITAGYKILKEFKKL